MENKTYPGSYYQPLFDLLNQEHGITPLESEMADIIVVVEKMRGANAPTGLRWVRASERLPEKCGKENSVVVRGMWEGKWPFVTYGFRNFSQDDPRLYYELGSKSECNNDVEWLDESDTPEQQSDAVAFGNWLAIERWQPRINTEWARYETIYSDVSVKTTAELYNIFKKEGVK
jgi:hypothetical protein